MSFYSKITTSPLSLALLAASLITTAPLFASSAQASNEARHARTMTLSARGDSDSKPDMASINTGIESVAVRARDALDDNNEVMERMMKSLKNAGLENRDIATTRFNIQPRYEHLRRRKNDGGQQIPKIIGYTVSNNLRITVRNLDNLGGIMDRLVTLGSNRIGSISFGLSDPDKALNEARRNAMRKVIDKAELYARAAGVRLGSITSISEKGGVHRPRPLAYTAKRSRPMAVPIAPGELKTSVIVHVKWALAE